MRRKVLFLSVAILTFFSSVFLIYVFYLRTVITESCPVKQIEFPATENLKNEQPEKIILDQSIRNIDFKNFTYNWFPKNKTVYKKKIVLRNGENDTVHLEGKRFGPNGEDYQEILLNISYADLTGDGKEEAIVTVGVAFYRWTPRCIFIFSEKNNKAVQIWSYETNTYDGNLDLRGFKVIEGNLSIEEFDLKDAPAYCCAKRYYRKVFAWNGKTFLEKSVETIPNEKGSKDYIGYPSEDF